MAKVELDLFKLNELVSKDEDIISEENCKLLETYDILNKEIQAINSQLPFPDITEYSSGIDYDDIARIQGEKKANRPYWERKAQIIPYFKDDSLHCGHVTFNDSTEYFIMDNYLESRLMGVNLINANDRAFSDIIKAWRYPDKSDSVSFSRNLETKDRHVDSVYVVLDKNSENFSEISDSYLRKALIRNKANNSIKSIIQTIQEKQNDIRALPANSTFALQGCAGSGKTMVMLHRLKFLIFNDEINSSNYLLLIPGFTFKKFIKGVAKEFNINEKNAIPFQYYYQILCGKDKEAVKEDINELVFDNKYLSFVYSKDLIKAGYSSFFELLNTQINNLISYVEDVFASLQEKELKRIDEKIEKINGTNIKEANDYVNRLNGFISIEISDDQTFENYISTLREKIDIAKNAQNQLLLKKENLVITDDDPRVTGNKEVLDALAEVNEEQIVLSKASIFTRRSHQKKLNVLNERLSAVISNIKTKIKESENVEINKTFEKMSFIFEDIKVELADDVLKSLISLQQSWKKSIDDENNNKLNIEKFLEEKYSEEIEASNKLIELSSSVYDDMKVYISKLIPCYDYVFKIISESECIYKLLAMREKNKVKLFAPKSEKQLHAYIHSIIFNSFKKQIKSEFDINFCNKYKHYWYLYLYCSYLSGKKNDRITQYIFIDESQDLSISELELIYKINSEGNNKPFVNLFGDINQTISTHGLSKWGDVDFIKKIYTLDENFRNTNQIIDYCNNELPYTMKKVGVEMDEVTVFDDISELHSSLNYTNITFIVKDDYTKEDLQEELNHNKIKKYAIYTVKEVKGLEFQEVITVDRDMTENEKYISYTRALMKLTVIHNLPYHTDHSKTLYINGTNAEEVIEE